MASAPAASTANTDFQRARRAMIDSQLRTSGISEPFVLNAMNRVPREDYVAADRRAVAYADRRIPLGDGRALSAPVAHALLLREAHPTGSENALLIGGASGYFAALFAPLVATLHVVEPEKRLHAMTAQPPGTWHNTPLEKGHKGAAPYDIIVIDGAVEQVPSEIVAQLAEDGRLVTGIVDRSVTRIAIGRRVGKELALHSVIETGIPVLDAFAAPKRWSF